METKHTVDTIELVRAIRLITETMERENVDYLTGLCAMSALLQTEAEREGGFNVRLETKLKPAGEVH